MKLSFKYLISITTLSLAVFSANAQENLRQVEPADLHVISEQAARDAASVTATFGLGTSNAATSSASAALPTWAYSVKAAQDGKTYTGRIVGASPSIPSTTTVPTVLIPVVLKITQGGVTFTFDPTQPDAGCLGSNTAFTLFEASPLFNSTDIVLNGVNQGTTQYIDAVQRSEFFVLGTSYGYHLLLSPKVGAALTISVNAGTSGNATAEVLALGGTQCGTNTNNINGQAQLGVISMSTIDAQLQNYIAAHGLNQSQLPYFVMYNSVISNGSANNLNDCCILGYHNALSNGQTYGIGDFEGTLRHGFYEHRRHLRVCSRIGRMG